MSTYIASLKKEKIKKNVLDIMAGVPREHFLDEVFKKDAHNLEPLPIGCGQAMDDPVALARMIEVLAPHKNWRLLEVGTGSGYSTALLAGTVKSMITMEYHEELAAAAKNRLADLGVANVKYYAGDATEDDRPMDEFDAIIIFAACLQLPLPLLARLKEGGVMVFPKGPAHQQQIAVFRNNPDAKDLLDNYKFLHYCQFPSIRGRYGWADAPQPLIFTLPDDGIAGSGPGRGR